MPPRPRGDDEPRDTGDGADTRAAETVLADAFDADFYRAEYPDIALPRAALPGHFCRAGWWEGRAPNADFDTVAYLEANPGLAASGGNPLLHYLRHAHAGGARAAPAARPTRATARLFGRPVTDWVARLRPHVALDFYAAQIEDPDLTGVRRAGPAAAGLSAEVDLVAHFAYRGWRLGLSPNPLFDTRQWLAAHPEAMAAMVNPLLVALERGAWPPRARPISGPMPPPDAPFDGWRDAGGDIDPAQLTLVRGEFSSAYYLHRYPDVRMAGLDPVVHYMTTGWREGRDPTAAFDTRYYLATNPDVAAAGIEPFWHYLAAGRREGRPARRPADDARRAIENARARAMIRPEPVPRSAHLAAAALDAARDRIAGQRGLVLSFSHDCYALSVGGVQIVVGEEQRLCAEGGWSYLHVSPCQPMLTLAAPSSAFSVRLAHDGVVLGICALDDLVDKLAARAGRTVVVMHSLLGFDPRRIAAVLTALSPERAYFWLHDYSSLCPGFNLLRNDVTFCGAPPADSMACRVCVHGGARRTHLDAVAALFAAYGLHVLAPSETALAIWRDAVSPPHLSARVHPHWILREVDRAVGPEDRWHAATGARSAAARVAFIGAQLPAKGWPAFRALAARLMTDSRYHLLHFGSEATASLPGVEFVHVRVTPADRYATIRELRASRVDYVVVLSPWPETFCFVAHEALIAGARVLCLADSGHVAALVARARRGRIFSDAAALTAFLESGEAIQALAPIEPGLAAPDPTYEIASSGTTADLILERSGPDDGPGNPGIVAPAGMARAADSETGGAIAGDFGL